MAPLSMSVRGTAVIPRTAERAVLHVEITSSGEQRKTVSEEVAQSSRQLQALLKSLSPTPSTTSHTIQTSTTSVSSAESAATTTPTSTTHPPPPGAPLAKWTMSSLRTTSSQPRDENYNTITSAPRTYSTSISFTLHIRDFSFLGALTTQLSTTIPHVKINEINWVLTDETRKSFESELRKLAARDAALRAQDYAVALGYGREAVKCIELREEGVNMSGGGGMLFSARKATGGGALFGAPAAFGGGGGQDGREEEVCFEDLEFVADEIEMSAAVDCRFEV